MTNCVCILIFNACEFCWRRTCWPQKVGIGGGGGEKMVWGQSIHASTWTLASDRCSCHDLLLLLIEIL